MENGKARVNMQVTLHRQQFQSRLQFEFKNVGNSFNKIIALILAQNAEIPLGSSLPF